MNWILVTKFYKFWNKWTPWMVDGLSHRNKNPIWWPVTLTSRSGILMTDCYWDIHRFNQCKCLFDIIFNQKTNDLKVNSIPPNVYEEIDIVSSILSFNSLKINQNGTAYSSCTVHYHVMGIQSTPGSSLILKRVCQTCKKWSAWISIIMLGDLNATMAATATSSLALLTTLLKH